MHRYLIIYIFKYLINLFTQYILNKFYILVIAQGDEDNDDEQDI